MKLYIDGKRRRFRKSIPADGQLHHIVGVFTGGEPMTLEIKHAKVSGRRRRVSHLFALAFGPGWKKVRP